MHAAAALPRAATYAAPDRTAPPPLDNVVVIELGDWRRGRVLAAVRVTARLCTHRLQPLRVFIDLSILLCLLFLDVAVCAYS